jgi:macrodomain Ter protein organizer (MatP/YcbG family)
MNWNEKTKLVQKDPVTCSRLFDHRVQQFIKIVLKSEFHPIGKVNDYFYRVEFQQRGSPHIHILIWVEDAPKYKENPNEDIVEYIDKHVSCNLSDEFKDLIALQVHKHSKTCRKKGHAICRFGFPLPPMKKTVILEPLDECVEKHKSMYKEIQEKINSLHELDNIEDLTFEEFLSDILHMTEEDYIKCVRSSLSGAKVFLQRKPYEVRVNPYMKVVLPAWKANHDLQFVLDPYACAMYIVSYISKSQKGMSALLDQAAKEAKEGNLDLKRQVRHIGNYFVNSVETSAQEAVYLTLQMPLTKATRQVVFINTSPPDKRTFLLKKTSELEKMSKDSTDIESNNDIKRYSKRPKALENWCLADYISQLQVNFPKNIKENDEQYSDNESESSASENEEYTKDGTKRIKIT